jgi:hypothetical protein
MSACLGLTPGQSTLDLSGGLAILLEVNQFGLYVCSTETLFAREDIEFPCRVVVLGDIQVQVGVSRPLGRIYGRRFTHS